MPENTLVKQALDMLTILGPEKSEWLGTVNFLLKKLGLTAHYQNFKLVQTHTFKNIVEARLRLHFVELWYAKLADQNIGKLRFYKLFKKTFARESYLDLISDFHTRKIITKFRCSDHVLEIEKGRHKNKKVEERVCKACNASIEDEIHFLNNCNKYSTLRTHYFGNPGSYNWIKILKCNTKENSFKLGNYLKKKLFAKEETS